MPDPLQPPLPRAPHGGPPPGDAPHATDAPILDFSANVNPLGPNPRLVGAARFADYAAYPDPAMRAVRESLAGLHGAAPDEVVPATGASELLHRVARAYLAPGSLALTVLAPFGEFARAVALQRADLREVAPGEAPDVVRAARPALVYLSRPHNPLGVRLPAADVTALAEACAEVGALVVLDEAYADLDPKLEPVPAHPALLRVRSPGKVQGLVGLRLGYAVGPADVIAALDNLAPAWPVATPALAALEALPREGKFLKDTVPVWRAKAEALVGSLATAITAHDVGLPFFTLDVGDARRVAGALLSRGVRVRDCASYGLPHLLRISARRSEDNRVLVHALRDVLRDA